MPHKKEYDREEKRTVEAVVKSAADTAFDPQGSYTGRPKDGGKPQQDADDL